MLPFNEIPYNDIAEYLTLNKYPVPKTRKGAYQAAERLIYSGKELEAPVFVTAWVIASNLFNTGVDIPTYKTSSILFVPDNNLQELAKSLSLDYVDKELILDILDILGRIEHDPNEKRTR